MAIQAACGLEEEYVKGIKLTLATAGAALTERRPVQVADVGVVEEGVWANPDRYLPPDADRPLWRRFLEDFRAFLLVPLIIRDEVYGVIALQYRRPHRFSEEEVRLASTVANQAALAIESARLREQAQQAAAVAERTRLARELHDSVTQSLYSVTLYAEAAARLLTNGQEVQASDYLREVRDTALEALREMRLLIFELRPPALQEVGLVGALQARLQAVEERAGIHVALDVSGSPEAAGFSIAVQTELYYLLKEALNNALKHARARQVWVDLCFDAPEPYFEVRDDGVGFEPVEAEAGGGLGMEGMRERSQRIHAQLEIRSRPLAGSTVRVQLSPLGIVRA